MAESVVGFGAETSGSVAISPADAPGDHAACDAEIARLGEHVARLSREHARHSLAVSAHKGRADQMESRAVRAEKQLARFLSYAEEYDKLAEQAADSRRNADLVTELRRRIAVLERSTASAVAVERKRIRRGVLAHEMVLQHPVDGDRVAGGDGIASLAPLGCG